MKICRLTWRGEEKEGGGGRWRREEQEGGGGRKRRDRTCFGTFDLDFLNIP